MGYKTKVQRIIMKNSGQWYNNFLSALALANRPKQMKLDGLLLKTLAPEEDGQPLREAVAILRRLGINPAYLAEEEPCCGGILHFMGAAGGLKSHTDSVNDRLKTVGVRQIISLVPSCTCFGYYTMKLLT